eukprot:2337554-Prymnesium_polylepis.1
MQTPIQNFEESLVSRTMTQPMCAARLARFFPKLAFVRGRARSPTANRGGPAARRLLQARVHSLRTKLARRIAFLPLISRARAHRSNSVFKIPLK